MKPKDYIRQRIKELAGDPSAPPAVKDPATAPPPEKKRVSDAPGAGTDPVAGAPVRLIVVKRAPRNEHLVIAHLPGADPSDLNNHVSLLVASNAHFLPKMTVPGPGRALLVTDSLRKIYTLQGACPRWRGRW